MPLYDYVNDETGEKVVMNVPVDKRDEQEGYTRLFTFSGMVSSTYGGLK